MELLRYRIFNKFNLLLFATFILTIFVYFTISLYLYQNNRFVMSMLDEDFAALSREEQEEDIAYSWELLGYSQCSLSLGVALVSILPVFVTASAFAFFKEKKGLFNFKYTRGLSYKKVCFSTMISHATIISLVFYIAYLVACLCGWGLSRKLGQPDLFTHLDIIFGRGFGNRHPLIYDALLGLETVFLFSFVYCMLTYAVCMFVSKGYIAMLITLGGIYFGDLTFADYGRFWLSFIRPTRTIAISGYGNFDMIIQGLYPLVLPALIGIVLIYIAFKGRERFV